MYDKVVFGPGFSVMWGYVGLDLLFISDSKILMFSLTCIKAYKINIAIGIVYMYVCPSRSGFGTYALLFIKLVLYTCNVLFNISSQ